MSELNNNPLVYIYNSHQLEEYAKEDEEESPKVIIASRILSKKLNKLGILSIVEKGSVPRIIEKNNLKFADSYRISRMFMDIAKSKYPSLEYFIDIHRDAPPRNSTTVTIDGKDYARILFLVGFHNKKYKYNLRVIGELHDIIDENHSKILRGVLLKKGPDNDGVYNQDFSSNAMLVEVGGRENIIEEVNNTLDVFALALAKHIVRNKKNRSLYTIDDLSLKKKKVLKQVI